MKNHLAKTGLSMSSAQTISNLCYQAVLEIDRQLNNLNNFSRSFVHDGNTHYETQGNPVNPNKVVDLLQHRARYTSAQAFLMENIKAKEELLKKLKTKQFVNLEGPESPKYVPLQLTPQIDETWGWDQLTAKELAEYWDVVSIASTIGQFIHKGGKLSQLRDELPQINGVKFIELKTGEKTPMTTTIHNTSAMLLALHNELATMHKDAEQRVNYYKAKVKNLITIENARISEENARIIKETDVINTGIRNEYVALLDKYQAENSIASAEFEAQRNKDIQETAAMRIEVDPRFQNVIDEFVTKAL